MGGAASVDDYIAAQPAERRDGLAAVRAIMLAAAGEGSEAIRYGMPAYRLPNGHPVYFACWKHHVSLHDIPTLEPAVEDELQRYRSGKDTLKFKHTDPLPLDLVERTIRAIASRPAAGA